MLGFPPCFLPLFPWTFYLPTVIFLEFKPIRLPIVLLVQRFLFLPLSSHV